MIRRARRLGAAALAVGATSAVLASAGPYALAPFVDLGRAAAADTTVAVAFVVDFGGWAAPVVGCVKVPGGTTGYQALAAFTAQEREQAPTYNASQLLCSINGIPGSGCGQAVSGGYDYWSYWHGSSGTWQYANTGAFAAVQPGDVEGWRFENPGKANPSDPPPGGSADYSAICGAATAVTTTTGAPGPPGGASPVAGPAAVAPGGSSSAPPSAGSGGSSPPPARVPSTTTVPATTVPGTGAPTTGPASGAHAQSLRAVNAATTGVAGHGVLPVAIGGGLVVVLAVLAFWRWRKRPRMP